MASTDQTTLTNLKQLTTPVVKPYFSQTLTENHHNLSSTLTRSYRASENSMDDKPNVMKLNDMAYCVIIDHRPGNGANYCHLMLRKESFPHRRGPALLFN